MKFYILYFIFISLVAKPTCTQNPSKASKEKIEFPEFGDYKMFLVGEIHNISSNYKFDLELIKYLYINNEVRNLIFEHSYSAAYLYNHYLKTGDESVICNDMLFHNSPDKREFWRELYQFNLALNEKITILGLDHERSYPFVKFLQLNLSDLPNKGPKLSIIETKVKHFLDNFKSPTNVDYNAFLEIKKEVADFISDEQDEFKQLPETYQNRLKILIKNEHSTNRDSNTNQKMYTNLLRILESEGSNGNFIGIFGSTHLLNNKKSLSNALKSNTLSPFKDSTCIIIKHYYNSYRYNDIADKINFTDNEGLNNISKSLSRKIYENKTYNFQFLPITSLTDKKKYHFFDYVLINKNQKSIQIETMKCN